MTTSLQSLSKKELLERASLLPHFKKSLAREKKEVLVQFLSAASTATTIATTTGGTGEDAPSVPLEPPEQATSLEKKTVSSLSRMTKAELLEACSTKEGFNKDRHGKTKATLLDFIKGFLPQSQDKKSQDKNPIHDEGIDPVNVGALLDTPDDVEAIKLAILRLLMDSAPFQSDPELKAKLDKIV